MYIVGNNNCLVINNTTEHITIREYKEMYSTTLQRRHPYTGREKNLEPGEHACYNPSKLKKRWRRDHMKMKISTELWVLFRGVKREMLSVSDFESNAGIVFNIRNNQLVKESVSREAADLSFLNHEKKLKQRLISIVDQRNAASTSQPQQGES